MKQKNLKGFTLIELLIVIAIIAILAAAVFLSLKPAERFQKARDARRQTDVESIAAAVVTYQVDNDGAFPASITSLTNDLNYVVGTNGATGCNAICTGTLGTITTENACVDLASLASDGYLSSVPQDPSNGTAAISLYYITKNSTGSITAGACAPEIEAISVTR